MHSNSEHYLPPAALPGASTDQSRLHRMGSWSLSSQRLASSGVERPCALEAPGCRAACPHAVAFPAHIRGLTQNRSATPR